MSIQPGQQVDRADMASLPEGTLIERHDGQVWQRTDGFLTSWVRIWGDEGAPAVNMYPAQVIWTPKRCEEQP